MVHPNSRVDSFIHSVHWLRLSLDAFRPSFRPVGFLGFSVSTVKSQFSVLGSRFSVRSRLSPASFSVSSVSSSLPLVQRLCHYPSATRLAYSLWNCPTIDCCLVTRTVQSFPKLIHQIDAQTAVDLLSDPNLLSQPQSFGSGMRSTVHSKATQDDGGYEVGGSEDIRQAGEA